MATRKESLTPQLVTVASTLNHPVILSYGGEALPLPPRGRVSKIDPTKLGVLPKGVRVS